jgi:hypothetical protein
LQFTSLRLIFQEEVNDVSAPRTSDTLIDTMLLPVFINNMYLVVFFIFPSQPALKLLFLSYVLCSSTVDLLAHPISQLCLINVLSMLFSPICVSLKDIQRVGENYNVNKCGIYVKYTVMV